MSSLGHNELNTTLPPLLFQVISNRTVTHEEVTDVHPSGSVPPVQCSTKTIQLQPAPQPSSSIYSLIKTGGASAASTEGAGSTNTASRDFPAYAAQLAARTRQPSQDDTSLDDSQESQYRSVGGLGGRSSSQLYYEASQFDGLIQKQTCQLLLISLYHYSF